MHPRRLEKGTAVLWFSPKGQLHRGYFWGLTEKYDTADSFSAKYVVVLDEKLLSVADEKSFFGGAPTPIDPQSVKFSDDFKAIAKHTPNRFRRTKKRIQFISFHRSGYLRWYNKQLLRYKDQVPLEDTPMFKALPQLLPLFADALLRCLPRFLAEANLQDTCRAAAIFG